MWAACDVCVLLLSVSFCVYINYMHMHTYIYIIMNVCHVRPFFSLCRRSLSTQQMYSALLNQLNANQLICQQSWRRDKLSVRANQRELRCAREISYIKPKSYNNHNNALSQYTYCTSVFLIRLITYHYLMMLLSHLRLAVAFKRFANLTRAHTYGLARTVKLM